MMEEAAAVEITRVVERSLDRADLALIQAKSRTVALCLSNITVAENDIDRQEHELRQCRLERSRLQCELECVEKKLDNKLKTLSAANEHRDNLKRRYSHAKEGLASLKRQQVTAEHF